MLAFLNQCASRPRICRSMCGVKCGSSRSCSPIWWFYRLPDHVPDPQNFNIAQNDMISTYGLSMTELGMIGTGFSITYGVGKTLVSYYADGKNTKQFLPFMLILSAICMLGFSASMGARSTSLFLMIAFYALSGFFQSTGGSCSYSTITKWTPRRKRGTFLGFWNISHNLGGAGAAGVALFGANYLFDGHVIGMFIFRRLSR